MEVVVEPGGRRAVGRHEEPGEAGGIGGAPACSGRRGSQEELS